MLMQKAYKSVFYPDNVVQKIKNNSQTNEQTKIMIDNIINRANYFVVIEDDDIRNLIFDPYLVRSHYVNKNSLCPACGKKRLLYGWDMDPLKNPWKVSCPDCHSLFPTNDFYSFYKSGINEKGFFCYEKADKSLLYNIEHPDPNDPLYMFGVDDGRGYDNNGVIQRFIGAYLIHGHFGKLIIPAIEALSLAWLFTNDMRYAHKCAILLDRLADYWPDYDARSQSYMYDQPNATEGYVGYWHGSYSDISTMAYAYDIIKSVMPEDKELIPFIKYKKEQYDIPFKKDDINDLYNHIENRIFKDALANFKKCRSNFPMTHALYAVINTVLGNKETADELLEDIIVRSTECDGASKENGLTGYTNGAKCHLTDILIKFANIKPGYIDEMLKKHKSLVEAYRFFIDTLCIDEYYPKVGDCGAIARPTYKCIHSGANNLFMLYKCYKVTGESIFIKAIHSSSKGNYGNELKELTFLSNDEIDSMICEINTILHNEGTELNLSSVLKPKWHLAILRSGQGDNKRAVWLDFDWINSGHEHIDPMNIGLFAKGVDMMPDWGYPTVVYNGGFSAQECKWGKSIYVHNCATLDRSNGNRGEGSVDLWAIGENIKTVTCQNPYMIKDGTQYARTLSLVDISYKDSYIIDVFRMCGDGSLYERYIHASFGSVETTGLKTVPCISDYPEGVFIENLKKDRSPDFGWSVDFNIDDYFGYAHENVDRHLKCTDLTYDSQSTIADLRYFGNRNYEYMLKNELLIPCFITSKETLNSYEPVIFVQLIEPYEKQSNIKSIKRLRINNDHQSILAIQIETADFTDILLYNDPYNPQTIDLMDYGIKTDAMVSLIRKSQEDIIYLSIGKGTFLVAEALKIYTESGSNILEIKLKGDEYHIISGGGKIIKC